MEFADFMRNSDVNQLRNLAKKGQLSSYFTVESFDEEKSAWNATQWIEGKRAMTFLIHEEIKSNKNEVIGKVVTFDDVTKMVKHTVPNLFVEIWIPQFKKIK